MKVRRPVIVLSIFIFCTLFLGAGRVSKPRFPYKEAGLTERQAAAHLLSRFTFGIRPGDIDRVLSVGMERWLEDQLKNRPEGNELQQHLEQFKTLKLSNKEIANTYPNPGVVLFSAYEDGVIDRNRDSVNRAETRRKLQEYAKQKGFHPQRELIGEMMAQKLFRALYSEQQLREVLTDFWFNHFNVSITDNQSRSFVMTYERDAIRSNVFSSFRQILGGTAKHPAMLTYLDNAQSTAPEGTETTMSLGVNRLRNEPGLRGQMNRMTIDRAMRNREKEQQEMTKNLPSELRPRKGINENYARELMELHTMGVDGGYTQEDVINVARALTGWTLFPMGPRGEKARERLERGKRVGFIIDGDFLFRADAHDATEKVILGKKFPAGRGIEEGERVLDMLADNPSTARFISKKLAIRFISDNPSSVLVDQLAGVFTDTEGDLKAMIWAIAESPEFWAESARREKIKSPFEYTVSALRAIGANVQRPRFVLEWIAKMGEPLYAYSAPTGYPDRATQWINTGSLLNRMNFGISLASGRIGGVQFDLAGLNDNREPESVEAALKTYLTILLPERNLDETIKLLRPVVRDPDFAKRLQQSAPAEMARDSMSEDDREEPNFFPTRPGGQRGDLNVPVVDVPPVLAHVVGVILGSPEFQRR